VAKEPKVKKVKSYRLSPKTIVGMEKAIKKNLRYDSETHFVSEAIDEKIERESHGK
jgi:hypothetical protein